MEVCQIERKKCSWMKANKIPKKKKKKLARLKSEKGGLGKN